MSLVKDRDLPRQRIFTHDGLTVGFHDVGRGRTIVMLHNGGTSSTIWRHQVDALADDHRVVTVDLPGFGSSPRPLEPTTLERIVELVAALIEAEEMAPALLVGNCMGSNISATLARTHPDLVAGVLAVNPLTEATFSGGGIGFLHTMGRLAPAPTRLARQISRRVRVPRPVAELALRYQLGPMGTVRGLHRDAELLACQLRPEQIPALVDVLDDMGSYGALDSADAPSGGPRWIAWGERNRVLSRKRGRHLTDVLHAERVEVIDGCGHLPSLEDPDAITDLIRQILERTEAAGSNAEAATTGATP